jgi:antitoxin component YwqK of YwqJK toxin-antitoxin module
MYNYNSYHKVIIVIVGIIWVIFHFSQRSEEGLYFENGQVRRTGQVVKSLNEGIWTWYYKDGATHIKGNFVNGKREGVWKRFGRNGQLVTECVYNDNKLNGVYVEYDSAGTIIKRVNYMNDFPQ